MLIMGWGPSVEVLQPKSLRQEILDLHKQSIEKFSACL
jgi:predicted DNA-binding transcriptional regulator YafY